MSESLVSQITIGDVENLPFIEKKRNKVGRKPKINEKKYLEVVRRKRTTNDRVLSEYLGLNRSNIYRFRINNINVYEKALNIIANFETFRFDPKNLTIEMFRNIPVIIDWREMLKARRVRAISINDRTKVIYNVCIHLNTRARAGIDGYFWVEEGDVAHVVEVRMREKHSVTVGFYVGEVCV